MNKKLLVFALILVFPLAVMAEDSSDETYKHHTGKQRAERLTKELGLNPEQTGKLRTILTEQRAKIKEIRSASENAIKTMLTPEQLTRFEKLSIKGLHACEKKSASEGAPKE
jgi:Spy/CpxP family protein refolding chaperone